MSGRRGVLNKKFKNFVVIFPKKHLQNAWT